MFNNTPWIDLSHETHSFHILGIDPTFLNTDPEDWLYDENFWSAEKIVK